MVTFKAQEAPIAKGSGQLCVTLYPPPVNAAPNPVNGVSPEFKTITLRNGALPTVAEPKFKALVLRVNAGTGT
jgi:hypothetical protein